MNPQPYPMWIVTTTGWCYLVVGWLADQPESSARPVLLEDSYPGLAEPWDASQHGDIWQYHLRRDSAQAEARRLTDLYQRVYERHQEDVEGLLLAAGQKGVDSHQVATFLAERVEGMRAGDPGRMATLLLEELVSTTYSVVKLAEHRYAHASTQEAAA